MHCVRRASRSSVVLRRAQRALIDASSDSQHTTLCRTATRRARQSKAERSSPTPSSGEPHVSLHSHFRYHSRSALGTFFHLKGQLFTHFCQVSHAPYHFYPSVLVTCGGRVHTSGRIALTFSFGTKGQLWILKIV